MVDAVQVPKILKDRLKELVTDPEGLLVEWPNAPFRAPTDGATQWLRVNVRMFQDNNEILSATSQSLDIIGSMFVELFTPIYVGAYQTAAEDTGLVTAGLIGAAFAGGSNVSGVLLGAPTITPIGMVPGGSAYQINIQCPFQACQT